MTPPHKQPTHREAPHAHAGSKERSRKREEAKASSAAQRDALKEEIVPEAHALKDVPQLAAHPERLPAARTHLREAYLFLMQRYNHGSLPTAPKRKIGRAIMSDIINDDNFDRYLPLMVKESALDPAAKNASGATGYFQVTPVALAEINEYFDVGLTAQSLQYPMQNCVIGILYYELLADKNVNDKDEFKNLTSRDKKLMAFAMYNAGPGIVRDLWRHFGATSYDDFERKLSVELVLKLGTKQKELLEFVDPFFHVKYQQSPGLDNYMAALKTNAPELAQNVTIGTRTLSVKKIGEMLRYGRVIEVLQKLPVDSSEVIPAKITDEKLAVPKGYLNRIEAYSENRKIWSMSETLRTELVKAKYKGVSIGKNSEERANDREFLIAAIERFNHEYNPQFENVDDEFNNIVNGTSILIPTKAYLDIFKKDFDKDAEAKGEEADVEIKLPVHAELLRGIPLYKDPKLATKGEAMLTNKSKLNLHKIRTYPGLRLPPAGEARERTDYIILHSTATDNADRGAESTAVKRRAHYVVSRDGKIFLVRNANDAFDHAGRFRKPRGAIWNGDGDVSLHSIGIEVATKPGEEWNGKQYAAVNRLIHALGEKYKIQAKNVLTHSQVANSKSGRGRKQDPMNLNWEKLGLPNNYLLVDTDVVTGRVEPNFVSIKDDWAANAVQREHMIEGLRYSVELKETYRNRAELAQRQTEAQWKKEMLARGVVEYTVRNHDTLWSIARTHKTSVRKIQVLNDMRGNKLMTEKTLKLPKPS